MNVKSPDEQARRDNMHGFENSMSGLMSSGLLPSSSAPVNIPGSSMGNSISGILQGTSAPVNIPGSSLGHNFSPSSHSNLFGLHDPFGTHHIGSGSAPKLSNNSYGHNHTDNFFFHSNNIISPVLGDALSHVKALTEKLEQMKMSGNNGCPPNYRPCDLRGMPLAKLKSIQAKLREEIEEVEIVLYQETANKCMKCEEKNRSVTLVPCNHYVVCDTCATTQRECPYCQTPVTPKA
uniref:RING-type domain-containing protein n=1 Tax=Anopheles coluzzii TaxID=1518534 RepID=A0A8W7PL36_ANOCL